MRVSQDINESHRINDNDEIMLSDVDKRDRRNHYNAKK